MIKLLKNEFRKILRKKIIYIMLALIVIVIIANTIIGTSIYGGTIIDHTSEAIVQQETELTKELNKLDKRTELEKYIETKTELDLIKLQKQYPIESWQEQVIFEKNNELINLFRNINISTENGNDKELAKYKKEYDNFMKPINDNNWKEFAKDEIYRYEKNIEKLNEEKKGLKNEGELQNLEIQQKQNEFEIRFLKLRLEENISFEDNDRNKLLEEYKNEVKTLESYPKNYGTQNYNEKVQYNKTVKNVKELEYKIHNNIPILKEDNARDMLMNSLEYYEVLIILAIIIISATIISEEFNKGTIKLLLIKPYKRWKIFLAKLITTIIMTFLILAIIFIVQFIAGGMIYNFNDYSIPIIEYNFNNNTIIPMDIMSYFITILFAKLPMYILILVTTLMLSILSSNSAISIILGMALYLSKNLIYINENVEFMKYFVGVNWDFSRYLFGNIAEVSFLTKDFSSMICTLALLIILTISIVVFNRKDIKNI